MLHTSSLEKGHSMKQNGRDMSENEAMQVERHMYQCLVKTCLLEQELQNVLVKKYSSNFSSIIGKVAQINQHLF
jgi:hypothetical protein